MCILEYKNLMELNHWANVNLTYLVLPHLIKSAEEQNNPKIVVVSSLAGIYINYCLWNARTFSDLVFPS